MNLKKLLPWAVAAAFAVPSTILAQGPSGTSSMGNSPSTGGSPSTQSAGEPKAPTAGERPRAAAGSTGATSSGRPDFSAIDKNSDGNISRSEWDAFYRDRDQNRAASGGTSSSGKTGTTAGPGEASSRTAPGSATATKPDTSGQGKAQ
jgi:hypothetical protein